MIGDRELNEVLDAWSVAPAGAGLRQRILAEVSPPSPWAELLRLVGGWRIAGPALAFSLVCGVATQLWLMPGVMETAASDSLWEMAMLETTQEESDE